MVKLNRIYTRTGDAGTTGLVDGSRLSKAHVRMVAIGEVDEANSVLGVAAAAVESGPLRDAIARIQNDLFDLGADLAMPWQPDEAAGVALRVTAGQVARLEAEIDAINADLQPLTSFILPGGSAAAAALHVARAVARRAERAVVALAEQVPVPEDAAAYINRLSDYLFVAARAVNQMGVADVLWVPGAQR